MAFITARVFASLLLFLVGTSTYAEVLEISVVPEDSGVSIAEGVGLERLAGFIKDRLAGAPDISAIEVSIKPGRYVLEKTFVLSPRDFFGRNIPIAIRAEKKGSVILSGLKRLSLFDLVKHGEIPAVIPANSYIYKATLPELAAINGEDATLGFAGKTKFSFPLLVANGKVVPYAALPFHGYSNISYSCEDRQNCISFEGIDLGSIGSLEMPFVKAFWFADWADSITPLQVNLVEGRSLGRVSKSASQFGFKSGQRGKIVNILSGLLSGPSWVFSPASQRAFLNVGHAITSDDEISISVLDELVRIEGMSNVLLDGLVLEGARKFGVRILGGNNNVVRRSVVVNMGEIGVWIDGASSGIEESKVFSAGTGGIVMHGGDRDTLSSGGVFSRRNEVCGIGWLVSTIYPSVFLDGVGNVVDGNLVSNSSHIGILAKGSDHKILFNRITNIGRDSGDVGAIYVGGRDWTARGTQVSRNYIFDVSAPGAYGERGIYLDDQVSGVSVTGNVIRNLRNGVFIGGGSDNKVVGNFIFNSMPAIHFDNRGVTWQHSVSTDNSDRFLTTARRFLKADSIYFDRYPELRNFTMEQLWVPKRNVVSRNSVVFSDGEPLRAYSKDVSEQILAKNIWHKCKDAASCDLIYDERLNMMLLEDVVNPAGVFFGENREGYHCLMYENR